MFSRLITIIEILGIISYAVSGSMVGIGKGMDVFGVAVLGLTTCVGGGIVRDILIGQIPPSIFNRPSYILIAIFVSLIMFSKKIRNVIKKQKTILYSLLMWMDTIGLGIFTVVGVSVAIEVKGNDNILLILACGVITAVGGGAIRDVMAMNIPFIFVKEFYALAALIGAIVCLVVWNVFGEFLAIFVGAMTVILLRYLSRRYHWKIPNAKK